MCETLYVRGRRAERRRLDVVNLSCLCERPISCSTHTEKFRRAVYWTRSGRDSEQFRGKFFRPASTRLACGSHQPKHDATARTCVEMPKMRILPTITLLYTYAFNTQPIRPLRGPTRQNAAPDTDATANAYDALGIAQVLEALQQGRQHTEAPNPSEHSISQTPSRTRRAATTKYGGSSRPNENKTRRAWRWRTTASPRP